jgi:chondroitin 4-sulfotransferase 11
MTQCADVKLIDHDKKCIFFCIRKNASSSLINFFRQEYGADQEPNMRLKGKNAYEKYPNYLKIAIVRNPWNRIASCYVDKILNKARFPESVFVANDDPRFHYNMSFDEFVNVICDIPDADADHHFKSQYLFLTNQNNELVVDFIIQFELLNLQLNSLFSILQYKSPFPHIRKRKQKPYHTMYTQTLIEKIRKRYEQDILLFQYSYNHLD